MASLVAAWCRVVGPDRHDAVVLDHAVSLAAPCAVTTPAS
jgi:hypothetical protein